MAEQHNPEIGMDQGLSQSVAIIRLSRKTAVFSNESYVKLDRTAVSSQTLDLVEVFLLEAINGLLSEVLEEIAISVIPEFYINQVKNSMNDERTLFTSLKAQGDTTINQEILEKLKSAIGFLTDKIVGNTNVFNLDHNGALEIQEIECLQRHANQFLARNGCKKISDALCVHAGPDDTVGVQIKNQLAPSDTFASENHAIQGNAFLDGYIMSKNTIYLVETDNKQRRSRPFICDNPDIMQLVREGNAIRKVYFTGYERHDGYKKTAPHITALEICKDDGVSVDDFSLTHPNH